MSDKSCEHLEETWDRGTGSRATDSRSTVHGGGSDVCGTILILHGYTHACMLVSLCVHIHMHDTYV